MSRSIRVRARHAAVVVCAAMLLTIAGCGTTGNNGESSGTTTAAAKSSERVGPPAGTQSPCNTYVYTLSKYADNSMTPTDIPVDGLTNAHSIAVDKSGIYVADDKRVVKIVK